MSKEFRHIIRVAEADLDGNQKVVYALTNVKGIKLMLANLIVKKAGINQGTRLGFLSDAEIEKIEEIIKNPTKYDIPGCLLNRPKDGETGKDIHLISSGLVLQKKMDIDQMKKIKSWRGFRHAHGLKVRGQRTKTTGRSGKAMGVKVKIRREAPQAGATE